MTDFDLKSWIYRNTFNVPYNDIRAEGLDPETGFADDTENRGDMEETVGWATKVKLSNNLLAAYIDKLNTYDWYNTGIRGFNAVVKRSQDKKELMKIYSELSDTERQEALDVFIRKAEKYFPEKDYPSVAQLLKTLTTANFDGTL